MKISLSNLKKVCPFSLLIFFYFFNCTNSYSQCPGPNPCTPGSFNPAYEQINPASIAGSIFCSGQTRTFTINVGPGTTTQAATGDLEFITLFFDFDCDGVYEYSVNNSCSYNNPGGCNVDLSVTAPTVTAPTTFNGRAHLVYNTPTTNPCSSLTWGDIEDFTITVNLPPEANISSSDNDNIICLGDETTFTATGGDEYEFFKNGVSVQGQSSDNTYTTSTLLNNDAITVLSTNISNGCDTLSSELITTVYNPSIDIEPIPVTAFSGDTVNFSVTTTLIDSYQWQVSTDNGLTFNDITDNSEYSGTNSATLTLTAIDINKNGNRYRVVTTNVLANCSSIISADESLTVAVRSVITNRRITYRVNKS